MVLYRKMVAPTGIQIRLAQLRINVPHGSKLGYDAWTPACRDVEAHFVRDYYSRDLASLLSILSISFPEEAGSDGNKD